VSSLGSRLRRVDVGLVLPAVLASVWFVALQNRHASVLLPGPRALMVELLADLRSDTYWKDIATTAARAGVAFVLSTAIGVPLGLVVGLAGRRLRSVEAAIDFLRAIPPIVLFPLFALSLGVGEATRIGLAFVGCVTTIAVHAISGVRDAPPIRREIAHLLGISRVAAVRIVVLPEAMTSVATGLRLALSLSLVLVVVTEMFIGAESGLGRRVYEAYLYFRVPALWVAIISLGILSWALNAVLRATQLRMMPWVGKSY
jgi:ABC-type nitrate/sulfonate/bicarbonate transport system permease component